MRAGEEVALIGLGTGVEWCSLAAALLEKEGVDCTVVNARFAKPLDEELLLNVIGSHRQVVIVEEHQLMGGFGSAVLELCESKRVDARHVQRLGLPDSFIPQAPRPRQLHHVGLTPQHIAQCVREALGKHQPVIKREVPR